MKAITGEMYNTVCGTTIVYEEQSLKLFVGETVLYKSKPVKIKKIISPSKPQSPWSVVIEQ